MTDPASIISPETLPPGGRVLVAASRDMPGRRGFLAKLETLLAEHDGEVIDAGVVGEWQQGDDAGPPPHLVILILHEGCPHGHGHRLAEQLMQETAASQLDMVVIADTVNEN